MHIKLVGMQREQCKTLMVATAYVNELQSAGKHTNQSIQADILYHTSKLP